jgi:hypothetical protein
MLSSRRSRFLLIEGDLSRSRVTLEIAHVEFNMLGGESLLLGLEFHEFLAVDHRDPTRSAGTTTRATLR